MSKSFRNLINKMPIEHQKRIKQKAKMLEAFNGLSGTGEIDTTECVYWRNAFPGLRDAQLPGVCLKGARIKEGITQRRLAELTGIKPHHISDMENYKRSIGNRNAKKSLRF
ncbi:helix-turn-helix domain-containing protein [Thermodesulfobacteriota bacterium]